MNSTSINYYNFVKIYPEYQDFTNIRDKQWYIEIMDFKSHFNHELTLIYHTSLVIEKMFRSSSKI